MWTGIKNFFTGAVEFVQDGYTNIKEWVTAKVSSAWQSIKDWFFGSVDFVVDGAGNIKDWLVSKVTGAWSSIKEWFSGTADFVVEGATGLKDFITSSVSNSWSNVKNWFSGTADMAAEKFTDFSAFVGDKMKNTMGFAEDLFSFSKEDMTAAGVTSKLIDIGGAGINLATNFAKDVFGFGNPEEPFKLSEFLIGDEGVISKLGAGLVGLGKKIYDHETGEIDKENCMGGDIDNYYKFFQAGSQLQGSLIMKELAKDPLYTKVINEVEQKFNQRLEHDAKELGVSKESWGWQFAIDWPFTDTWSLGRGAEKTLRDIANKRSKKNVLNDLDRQNNFKTAFDDALEIQYHDPKLIHAAKNGLPITEEMLIESKNSGYKPTPDNEKVCIAEGVFESFKSSGRSAGAKTKNMTAYKSAPTIIPCGEKGREIWENDTGVPSDHAKYSTMTFKEYKDMMKESIVINNLSALEDFKEIFKEEKVIQDLTEFDYDKLSLVPSAEVGNL